MMTNESIDIQSKGLEHFNTSKSINFNQRMELLRFAQKQSDRQLEHEEKMKGGSAGGGLVPEWVENAR